MAFKLCLPIKQSHKVWWAERTLQGKVFVLFTLPGSHTPLSHPEPQTHSDQLLDVDKYEAGPSRDDGTSHQDLGH